MSRIIIAGAGHAGGQVAARLRQEGVEGEVVLIGAEAQPPYQRPPLSKAYLAGELPRERVLLRAAAAYEKIDVALRVGRSVSSLDTEARRVTLDDGESLDYAHIVLATGARVRSLDTEGSSLDGIHYLRTLEDSDRLRETLSPGRRVVIVGGGYIGLEVAAVAARAGAEVTVLEMAPRLLARVSGEAVAAHYRALHEAEGVRFRFGARVTGFAGDGGRVASVALDGGEAVACDAVVVGVGVLPETTLAESAGLEVSDGIVVDAHCRASAAGVYAAGDCTRHPSGLYGGTLRLESVHNAMTQARVVAANLAGKDVRYDEVPWFWSDQYDAKLQLAGIADAHDESVLRGEPSDGSFSVIYLREGRVIAGESVNAMQDHMALRGLITARAAPSREALGDTATPLKTLLPS